MSEASASTEEATLRTPDERARLRDHQQFCAPSPSATCRQPCDQVIVGIGLTPLIVLALTALLLSV